MEALLSFLKQVLEVFKSAPDVAFEIALIYSVLTFTFFLAALIRRSKTAALWGALLAIGITGAYTAVKFLKQKPAPPPSPPPPVERTYKASARASNPDEAVMKIAEKLFDQALNLKKYGFAKLPLYQKEMITNRLLSVLSLVVRETPEGVVAEAKVKEKDLFKVLESLGYSREGKNVVVEVVNAGEVHLLPQEVDALVEGIKRTSVFFLDDKLYTDIEHLRQELVGMKLGRGLVITDVRGTSTTVDIYLARER